MKDYAAKEKHGEQQADIFYDISIIEDDMSSCQHIIRDCQQEKSKQKVLQN